MLIECPSCFHTCEVDDDATEYTCPECGEEVTLCTPDTTEKPKPFVVCQNCFVKIEFEELSPFDTLYCPRCGAEIDR